MRVPAIARTVLTVAVLATCLGPGAGCSRQKVRDPKDAASWRVLVEELSNTRRIARMDTPGASLISSYDRTGGNNDFNYRLRNGPEGWWVLADLQGPGFVSRFWCTGAPDGKHRLRFYFDGEKEPRLETTLDEFCGGSDQYCWYSYTPLPFAKRLVIMAQKGSEDPQGWPRLFFQINHNALPPGLPPASLPAQLNDEDRALIARLRRQWQTEEPAPAGAPPQDGGRLVTCSLDLAPGANAPVERIAGPATICELTVEPDLSRVPSAAAREEALRDVVLRIRWNDREDASVDVPLGDFFGSFWRPVRFDSMFLGARGGTFRCSFPMPFRSAAAISFENQGRQQIGLRVTARVEPMSEWSDRWGYFHSGWLRTGPEDVGRPHPIVDVRGKGKYVGCILGVTSVEPSFWILEGDEIMQVDGGARPTWFGTGLEDYFNGGWYYQNARCRPLSGLTFKAHFRTVQYRYHVADPVCFDSSLAMTFERGPKNESRGWMESVSFYYMAEPMAACSRPGTREGRLQPPDPLEKYTIMPELWSFERFGDYGGASERTDSYLERHTDFPFAAVLRLRQAAYRERAEGFEAVRGIYQAFAADDKQQLARDYARLMLWYNEQPSRAVLGAFCNTPTTVYLDGQPIGTTANPEMMAVWQVNVSTGRHVLAMAAKPKQYPAWAQLCLRTHYGDIVSTPRWNYAVDPSGRWTEMAYDDSSWKESGGLGCKGPPEEPYIWVVPDPFVDMESKAVAVGVGGDPKTKVCAFRKVFELGDKK